MSDLRTRSSASKRASATSTSKAETNGHSHEAKAHTSKASSHLHSHSHSHDHDDDDGEHTEEALMLLDALRGKGDAGSRVTLMGLGANVGLTLLKGTAGWYLNSAALIADAGHSLSDLVADIVTLGTVILSQRPPSPSYPLGYGKFESLAETLSSTLSKHPQIPPLLVSILSYFATSDSDHGHGHGHSHSHHAPAGDEDLLSPSAVLFPLFGMLVKEYLYRVTKRVAEEQNSSVLLANALHHRSDAYGSIVTVVAILGSLVMKDVPVDPMGGALFELTDASVAPTTLQTYHSLLEPLLSTTIKSIGPIRAVRSGSAVFVDVDVVLRKGLTGVQVYEAVESIKEKLRDERKEIKAVRVSFAVDG
ncbi:9261_t:CDS:2 [Acaulospora colombiana]|uniref:9261_t:CDS:1 n=1 Tax=Acaulospora colombiana TaxID=27376 RepID=A0ACA9MJ49_9GLOM|nr:9261_t:CDS:2 [Acaulospora colombiana]